MVPPLSGLLSIPSLGRNKTAESSRPLVPTDHARGLKQEFSGLIPLVLKGAVLPPRTRKGPFVADQLKTVQWHGHRIYVPPLSAQLRTCELRGLSKRVDLIRSAIRD